MSSEHGEANADSYTFKVHARKITLSLSCRTAVEANEWVAAIQDAIDTCPTIQTITERVILEIIVRWENHLDGYFSIYYLQEASQIFRLVFSITLYVTQGARHNSRPWGWAGVEFQCDHVGAIDIIKR